MQKIRISHSHADVADGFVAGDQGVRSFGHAVMNQEFLRRLADYFLKYFAKIASVQFTFLGDIFYCNILLIFVFVILDSFPGIEFAEFSALQLFLGCGVFDQTVHEQIQVSDPFHI